MPLDTAVYRSVRAWAIRAAVSLLITTVVGCDKEQPPPKQMSVADGTTGAPKTAPPAEQPAAKVTAAPSQAKPDDKAEGADAGTAAWKKETDHRANGWGLPSQLADVVAGDRVYVMTRGRNRTYTDANAVYQLYAYDVAAVRKDRVTIRELGGGTFDVSGLFVIPAGTDVKKLRKGDMVLAEWASTLKHAIITGFEGRKVKLRYTDLPDSWSEEKVAATVDARLVTRQKDGFYRGNHAIADIDGRDYLVMLINKSGESWLVRRFAGRVANVPQTKLRPLPLIPTIRRRQKVLVPWVGMMYRGTVRKVRGTRVLVSVPGIGQKEPIVASVGQVMPLSR